jgi:hypothetical protein
MLIQDRVKNMSLTTMIAAEWHVKSDLVQLMMVPMSIAILILMSTLPLSARS